MNLSRKKKDNYIVSQGERFKIIIREGNEGETGCKTPKRPGRDQQTLVEDGVLVCNDLIHKDEDNNNNYYYYKRRRRRRDIYTKASTATSESNSAINNYKICGLQLPKEPHRSTRLLKLTGR